MKHEFKSRLLRKEIDHILHYREKHLDLECNPIRCRIEWEVEFQICSHGVELSICRLKNVEMDVEIYDDKENDYINSTRHYKTGVDDYKYKFIYESKSGTFMPSNIEVDEHNKTIEITLK